MATATQPIQYQSPIDTILTLLGNRNTNTDTQSNQQTVQQLQSLLQGLTTNNSSGTTSGTTTNTANLGALQQVFDNNIGGMSADTLKNLIGSIFTEGAAQTPSIIGAYANATGSRASNNSGTKLALDELIKQLSTTAAQSLLQYNTQAQNTAANAAANIAANTRQTDTVQNQNQQQVQQQNQNTSQTSTGTTNSNQTAKQQQNVSPNWQNLAIGGGMSLLQNLLKGGNVSKLLGFGGADASGGLTMAGGASPLSYATGAGMPGGITSLSTPTFANTTPFSAGTAQVPMLNNNFSGISPMAAGASAPVAAAAPSFGGGGGGISTLGSASTLGNAGMGLGGGATNWGTFDGSGIMGAGSGLNFGGIGVGNTDFLGSALGGLGATGGAASSLAGSASPWGFSTAGNGGITDAFAGLGGGGGSSLGFGDFLSGGGGAGNFFGGIGDAIGGALSGAADWIGSFFADGGMVRRPGYADGGGIGAPGDTRYGNTGGGAAPIYGNNLFDTMRQRQALAAGLMAPPVQMQQGNIPRLQGVPNVAVNPAAVAGLIPMLIQQMLSPAGMSQPAGGGFADGGMVGSTPIFGMADGGQNYGNRTDGSAKGGGYYGEIANPHGGVSTELSAGINLGGQEVLIPLMVPGMPATMLRQLLATPQGKMPAEDIIRNAAEFAKQRQAAGLPFFAQPGEVGKTPLPAGYADGGNVSVRNRPNMGLPPVRQQMGAINYTGYDNPAAAEFVNAGGNLAEYVDPAVQAAQILQQAAGGGAPGLGGGGQVFEQPVSQGPAVDPRMADINSAILAITQGSPIQGAAGSPEWLLSMNQQAYALQNLAANTGDPEVANYYRYLAQNITSQTAAAQAPTMAAGGASSEGDGTATGATSASVGAAGGSGGVGPGIGTGASAVGAAIGAPIGLAVSAMDAIGQAVAQGIQDAAAPGGPGNAGDAASASSATGSAADAPGGASGIGGMGSGNAGDDGDGPGGVGVGGEGGDGGGGGGGKIICTAMNDYYGLPYRENMIWIGYAKKHLTPAHERGYHKLFLPLVDYGFKQGRSWSKDLVRDALIWIGKNRTSDIKNELAGRPRNLLHKTLRAVVEPILAWVGK